MSLEQAHQRSLQERPHHPDDPQPVNWGRAEEWNTYRTWLDLYSIHNRPTGRHRKPWGRRAAPWTLETAETDNESRDPEWSAAA